tara:strand:- start:221308 stop:221532 length:225 start_codon:yes stop_codon:yes gene_type:complete
MSIIEKEFVMKENQPFIELNKLLKMLQIAQTGGHAKMMIQNNEVYVNEAIETRIRKKLVKSDQIRVGNYLIKIG